MNITVIGTGYVGLVAGACFADMGNSVICVDNDVEKLSSIEKGKIPIFEPGLEDLVKTNVKEGRLKFSDNIQNAVQLSEVCFIAVGTPLGEDGAADLSNVYGVAEAIGKSIKGYKVIVNKSTVPVGTAKKIKKIIRKYTNSDFDIVSNPEFLKQGNAVNDFLIPDRVIIGSDSEKASKIMKDIYAPFIRAANKIIFMDIESAEMTKYAANSFLATKISFINEMANLCEKIGADIEKVRIGMASDERIGNKFLFSGIGYGGSCFPKDIKALIHTGSSMGLDMKILSAVNSVNNNQRKIFVEKVLNYYNGNVKDKTFAIWGLAFKPKTNDMREAPSIYIINELLANGAKIKAYDPKAIDNAKYYFKNKIEYSSTSYNALKDADAMLLLTEWNEFRHPDFEKMKSLMKIPVIFDGRNQYDKDTLAKFGFNYFCIGK